ncbi:hypothetical protein ACFROC_00925 [Nocardia tengchongensis]|uniref:hypothetical protein n=1 Tax=Nocardia tengchongensis TaxID=2055889 RepID=UPI00369F87DE
MIQDTLTLPKSADLEGMLENATPALRRAVLRALESNNDDLNVGGFCSFIDADLA